MARRLTRSARNIRWIETYCRVPEGKLVGQPVKLTAEQKRWLRNIYDSPTRMFILSMGRKNAKALALDTPIPTPDGWRQMRDIRAGDYVYGANGQPVRVVAESPVFIGKKCYRVRFSDGSDVVASEDHIWTTRHKYRPWIKPATYAGGKVRGNGRACGREVTENVTTAQIAESLRYPRPDGGEEFNHKIAVAEALQSADVELPIAPYTLGAWLGDGNSDSARFTIGEEDLPQLVANLSADIGPVGITRYTNRAPTIRTPGTGLQTALRKAGLLQNKHIPEAYFNAGTAQRWALLQGLMDTDGTVHTKKKTPRCWFTSTNKRLADGVWRLARSLGLKASVRTSPMTLRGVNLGICWQVGFTATQDSPVFRLERKQRLLPQSMGKRSRTISIIGCDEVESVPSKCIAVDSDDHLFLAGHGCIPTHNTATSAMLLLLHMCGPEARVNSQLVSAAQSRDQAALLFRYAVMMVRMSPDLASVVQVRDTAKQLLCPEIGTVYRALSADASTNFGLSPAMVIHDELGQVKGPRSELYEALETAAAAQAEPLSIIISTQAPTDADLLSLLIDDARTGADPRVKLALYTALMDLDPFSEEAIKAANPHFSVFMNRDEVLRQAADAKRMPSREAAYRNLILNQRVEARTPFVARSVWEENGRPLLTDEPDGPVYLGLDLSSVSDLTALVAVSPSLDRDGTHQVHCTFWLPESGLAEKSRADRVPYDLWHQQGYLQTTPGASIEYDYIAAYLRDLFNRCDVRGVAFDRYNMRFLKPCLIRAGFTDEELERFKDFGQGFVSMSPALRELESLLLARKLRHGMHPVLTMCAANATVVSDPAANRKFTKSKATGRIDGMVALAMAVSLAMQGEEQAMDLDGFLAAPIVI